MAEATTTTGTRFYECMFLVDANWASNDFDGVVASIEEKVTKHGGTIRRLERWQDERQRRLAYPIKRERVLHKFGAFILCALELPPEAPREIAREVELDSHFLRALILQRRDDEIDRIFESFPETDSRGRPIRAADQSDDEAGVDEDGDGDED